MATVTRPSPYSEARERMTRALLVRALEKHGGNLTRAASALGLTRTYVYKLLKRYGVKREHPAPR